MSNWSIIESTLRCSSKLVAPFLSFPYLLNSSQREKLHLSWSSWEAFRSIECDDDYIHIDGCFPIHNLITWRRMKRGRRRIFPNKKSEALTKKKSSTWQTIIKGETSSDANAIVCISEIDSERWSESLVKAQHVKFIDRKLAIIENDLSWVQWIYSH